MRAKLVNFKLLKPHRNGCRALHCVANRSWSTPWSFLDVVEYRDAIGRLNKHGRRWWRTKCNCADCPAEMIVNETFLLERCTVNG